jgi:hypothetical protein
LLNASDSNDLEDSEENLLEALEVPVLVDGSVDDSTGEDLLGLVRQKEHEVVESVDFLKVVHVLGAVGGKNLLTKEVDCWCDDIAKANVLASILKRALDLIH